MKQPIKDSAKREYLDHNVKVCRCHAKTVEEVSPYVEMLEEKYPEMKTTNEVSQSNYVEMLEEKYPEMTEEFKRIQREQYELFCRKQWNYGTAGIAMGTNLSTDEDIRLSTTGLVIRINDKSNRLVNLVIKQDRDGDSESIIDSFSDLANYSIMAMIVRHMKWGK